MNTPQKNELSFMRNTFNQQLKAAGYITFEDLEKFKEKLAEEQTVSILRDIMLKAKNSLS